MAVVAALQRRSPAFGRRTAVRRHRLRLAAVRRAVLALVFGLVFAGVLGVALTTPASAQGFTYNPVPPRPKPPRVANDGQMLVQAVEVDYDYNNSRVSAVGNVQMFYNGTSVEADKVIYDQKTKRLHAEGNIRMTDADGKITYANIMDLSDDYRDGFVNSLRVDTADQTRMAATRADRSSGNYTVFRKRRLHGLRPLQGRSEEAAFVAGQGRAHHSRPDREDAVLRERPARVLRRSDGLYAVFFDARSDREAQDRLPDAGLHRRTRPTATASKFRSTGPSRPTTTRPSARASQPSRACCCRPNSVSGWRTESYQIRAYGIDQLDPAAFAGQPGDRQFRGGVETKGQFALNDKWVWGWDGVALSDYYVHVRLPAGPVQGSAAARF